MACDGTRVFVLGGVSSPDAREDEAELVHVLDTSMYFPFVILFGQAWYQREKVESGSH